MAKEEEISEALSELELTLEEIESVPRISHVLAKCGGKHRWRELLEGSAEPEARELLRTIRQFSKLAWRVLPLEAFCIKAGISTKRAFGLIASEVVEQSRQEGLLVAASKHSDVVEATVASALRPDGESDRKLLLQHAEFLPMPKNNVIFAKGNVQLGNNTTTNMVGILPSAESRIKSLHDRFGSEIHGLPPALESPPRNVIDLDVETPMVDGDPD